MPFASTYTLYLVSPTRRDAFFWPYTCPRQNSKQNVNPVKAIEVLIIILGMIKLIILSRMIANKYFYDLGFSRYFYYVIRSSIHIIVVSGEKWICLMNKNQQQSF